MNKYNIGDIAYKPSISLYDDLFQYGWNYLTIDKVTIKSGNKYSVTTEDKYGTIEETHPLDLYETFQDAKDAIIDFITEDIEYRTRELNSIKQLEDNE